MADCRWFLHFVLGIIIIINKLGRKSQYFHTNDTVPSLCNDKQAGARPPSSDAA